MNEATKDAHPFPRSTEAFEDVVERARAAKIAAFAVVCVDPQGVVNWKWHFGNRPQTDLIGALECIKWTIVTKAMEPIPQPDIPDPPTDVRQ